MHEKTLILIAVAVGIGIVYMILRKLQVSGPHAEIDHSVQVSAETVAAISAALAVLLCENEVNICINSISPLPAKSNAADVWTVAGRHEVMKRQSPFSMIGRWGKK